MPSWTTVPAWAVGQIIKRVDLNRVVTAIGELQTWATADDARIATLESFVGTGASRPQLRVYAPASVTSSAVVPFATVRRDTHSGWSGSPNYRYTVPVSGLYHVALAWKTSSVAVQSNWAMLDQGTGVALVIGPNSVSATYSGNALTACIDLTASQVLHVMEFTSSYTPYNDATGQTGVGSNFWTLTYLGPTT